MDRDGGTETEARILTGAPGCCAAVLLVLALPPAGPRAGAALWPISSSHLIAISTGFVGTEVVLFGAIDGPGDVVAVVRGPRREITVRRKGKVAGIWVNAASRSRSGNVPSYLQVATNRPVERIAVAGARPLYRIGLGTCSWSLSPAKRIDRAERFGEALIRTAATCRPCSAIPTIKSPSLASGCSAPRSTSRPMCRPGPIT